MKLIDILHSQEWERISKGIVILFVSIAIGLFLAFALCTGILSPSQPTKSTQLIEYPTQQTLPVDRDRLSIHVDEVMRRIATLNEAEAELLRAALRADREQRCLTAPEKEIEAKIGLKLMRSCSQNSLLGSPPIIE